MTGQQQHLPEHCRCSSSALLSTFAGAVAEADESPFTAKAKPEGVRGKPEAQEPLFIKQKECGYEQEKFLCKLYQWRAKDCLLALAEGTARSCSPSWCWQAYRRRTGNTLGSQTASKPQHFKSENDRKGVEIRSPALWLHDSSHLTFTDIAGGILITTALHQGLTQRHCPWINCFKS